MHSSQAVMVPSLNLMQYEANGHIHTVRTSDNSQIGGDSAHKLSSLVNAPVPSIVATPVPSPVKSAARTIIAKNFPSSKLAVTSPKHELVRMERSTTVPDLKTKLLEVAVKHKSMITEAQASVSHCLSNEFGSYSWV